jgi:hypothetical protein
MGIYARRPWRLLGQLAGDVVVLAWVVAWAFVGRFTHRSVLTLAGPARETAGAAGRLSTQLGQAAEQAAKVPGVGAQLRQPLDAASASLTDLLLAANRQVAGVEQLADLLGWLVFAIPVSIVVAGWLRRRIAFVVRARAAQRFLDSSADLDLFALRALASQPMHVLARISPDPVAAWREGDATVIHKLADVELRRSGLRMPTTVPPGHDPDGGKRRIL